MPSWNIHTAHVERLLREGEPLSYGVRDANDFLFGNLVPDIYVGYMVQGTSRTIAYAQTHMADPTFMPLPDADLFWERYIAGRSPDEVSDVALGTWAHLTADRHYNAASRRIVAEKGLVCGDPVRVLKQRDFDTFGRTLDISMSPEVTPELLAECADFPQYPILAPDVRLTCDSAFTVVRHNASAHVSGVPRYDLLDADFFRRTFDEVDAAIAGPLRERARFLGLA